MFEGELPICVSDDGQDRLFYFITSKIWALFRHKIYLKFLEALEGTIECISYDEFNLIVINEDFNTVITEVLDLFKIDYYGMQNDADIIMRKLEYINLQMPPMTK